MDELIELLGIIREKKEDLPVQTYKLQSMMQSMEADLKSLEWRVTMLMAGELYFEDGIDEKYMEREIEKIKKDITSLKEEMKW